MPRYDYECSVCRHAWECEQRITEAPVTECPECERHTAKRLISGATSFALKGSRWAKDGYR